MRIRAADIVDRSLNMDCENQEKDKDGNPMPGFNNGTNNSECMYLLYFSTHNKSFSLSFQELTYVVLCCRYSDYRLHTGPVPAHRRLGVSARHVLLLRLGTGGLHHLHGR